MSFDPQAQQRAASLSDTIAKIQATATSATWESWVEGSRSIAATLDSGIQTFGLEVMYWRVHKVGWFRYRVVFGVRGKPERVAAFRAALDKWLAAVDHPST